MAALEIPAPDAATVEMRFASPDERDRFDPKGLAAGAARARRRPARLVARRSRGARPCRWRLRVRVRARRPRRRAGRRSLRRRDHALFGLSRRVSPARRQAPAGVPLGRRAPGRNAAPGQQRHRRLRDAAALDVGRRRRFPPVRARHLRRGDLPPSRPARRPRRQRDRADADPGFARYAELGLRHALLLRARFRHGRADRPQALRQALPPARHPGDPRRGHEPRPRMPARGARFRPLFPAPPRRGARPRRRLRRAHVPLPARRTGRLVPGARVPLSHGGVLDRGLPRRRLPPRRVPRHRQLGVHPAIPRQGLGGVPAAVSGPPLHRHRRGFLAPRRSSRRTPPRTRTAARSPTRSGTSPSATRPGGSSATRSGRGSASRRGASASATSSRARRSGTT